MSKDTIYREDAILAMANALWHYPNDCYKNLNVYEFAKALAELGLRSLPSAQPERIQNNAVHLCDSCQYTYVTCPSHGNDAVFGDGKGNDNICACNKYRPISAQTERPEQPESIVHCEDCQWLADIKDVETGELYHTCGVLAFDVPDGFACNQGKRKGADNEVN